VTDLPARAYVRHDIDQPVAGVVRPASVQMLEFEPTSNQLIAGVEQLTSWKEIRFVSSRLDQPISGVVRSASLLDAGVWAGIRPTHRLGRVASLPETTELKAAVPQQFEEQRAIDWEARREWPDLKFFC